MLVAAIRMNLPVDKRKELVQTFHSLFGSIRDKAGCVSCRLYSEFEDDEALILIEEWRTKEDWDEHLHSREFAILLGAMSLARNPSAVEFKLIKQATGLKSLKAVRNVDWY